MLSFIFRLFFVPVLLVVFFMISGCQTKHMEEVEEAAEDYGDALIKSYQGSQVTADYATLRSIENTIQTYRSINGKYPESLEEIQGMMGSPLDPNVYEYNPATGEIFIRNSQFSNPESSP